MTTGRAAGTLAELGAGEVSIQERRWILFTACGCTSVTLACLLGLTPLYPEVGRDLNLSAEGLGAVPGWFLFMAAFTQIPIGVAIDYLGARWLLVAGLMTMAASQVVRGEAANPLMFGVSNGLFALCAQVVMSSGYAAVAQAFGGYRQAQATGTLTASAYIGQGAGYLISGAIGHGETIGPVVTQLRQSLLDIQHGCAPDVHGWMRQTA